MDLDGEEPIQEDDEDEMGWQESTKDPGVLGGVDGAASLNFTCTSPLSSSQH